MNTAPAWVGLKYDEQSLLGVGSWAAKHWTVNSFQQRQFKVHQSDPNLSRRSTVPIFPLTQPVEWISKRFDFRRSIDC